MLLLYVAAEGARDGGWARDEFVRTYRPRELAGKRRSTITWATPAGLLPGSAAASPSARRRDVTIVVHRVE